jgi:triosephosphate isomerase (TIM)
MAEKPVLAANWKMNPIDPGDAAALVRGIQDAAAAQQTVEVAVFPPFPWILGVAELLAGGPLGLGGQDCHWEDKGAFTGCVSAPMLARAGCGWVIVGHSERRQLGETDEQVAKKAAAALGSGLQTIICVGETLEQHESGQSPDVVETQARAALADVSADDARRLLFAYEPIWAIGSGKNADPEHAYRHMRLIRMTAARAIGKGAADKLRVLYGGSVNRANVEDYVELPQCDGCLVGGASLKADEFSEMIRLTAEVYSRGSRVS